MPHESQVVGWPGRTLFDADGSKVGKIEDVFADERTGRPAWATVSSGLFGRRHHFVPIENAREVEDGVAVPVAGQLIKGAPNVDADGDLSRDDERALYRHYGLDDGEPDGTDAATPGATGVDADHDGRDDRTEHDASDDRAGNDDRADQGYAHHDERTRHDADGDGRDDRAEDRGAAAGAGDAAAAAGAAHGAGTHDDARGSGVPPTLQADATTEALARAERERLAAAEAEHDRLAARQAERPAHEPAPSPHEPAPSAHESTPSAHEPAPSAHEPAVLDRELAQQDLSVAPAADDRLERGEPGFHRPPHDESAFDRPTQGDHDRTPGSPGTGAPSVGTRLRRLARSITPSSKDDHHG